LLSTPVGVAVDSNDNVAISDAGNYRVRVVCKGTSGLCSGNHIDANYTMNAAGPSAAVAGDIYTVTGTGSSTTGDKPGSASNVSGVSSMVAGVGFDSNGNLFVSDPGNSVVLVVCAGSSGVCGNLSGAAVTHGAAGAATAYNLYSLNDGGSTSDGYASDTGYTSGPAGIGFNFQTHAIGFGTSVVVVSDRDNNLVRYMNY
jgi:hypothetical protein